MLQLAGETDTVGALLRACVCELFDSAVAFVGYRLATQENMLRLELRSTDDVVAMLRAAALHAVGLFEAIARGVQGAPAAPLERRAAHTA